MEITKQEPVEKFTVKAGFELGVGRKMETLAFQLGDTQVKLNAEQCEKLLRVLDGKCHKIYCYESGAAYSPHSMLLFSVHEEKPNEWNIYSEKSVAKF
jgi:hypothetical protein